MADDLHTRLLAATSALTVAEERTPEELAAALRAVVELHAPETIPAGHNLVYTACSTCQERDEMAAWPCSTIQAIARELGVEGA